MKTWIYTIIIIWTIVIFSWTYEAQAGEWNEKPIMCSDKKETFDAIKVKNEVLIFTGVEFAKVRSETGYAVKPATLPFKFYVNFKTGTYTVLEHHPSYSTYCIIAYGVNLQSFVGGLQ